MPQAIPLAIGVGGSLLSGIAGSGRQASNKYNQNQSLSGSSVDTENINTFQEAVEDPAFAQFRQGLLPMFGAEMARLQKPIFGDAQKADFLGSLNRLAQSSMNSLRANLARSGALDSGRYSAGLRNIEMGKLGEATKFFSQLPFQEEMARREGVGGLLGLATNFAGRAPISQRTTGANTMNRTFNQSGTTSGTQEQYGPSMWRGMAGGLAGVAGDLFARSNWNPFGRN